MQSTKDNEMNANDFEELTLGSYVTKNDVRKTLQSTLSREAIVRLEVLLVLRSQGFDVITNEPRWLTPALNILGETGSNR